MVRVNGKGPGLVFGYQLQLCGSHAPILKVQAHPAKHRGAKSDLHPVV
jgi:hypothetical protein